MRHWMPKSGILSVAVTACLLCHAAVQAKGPPKPAAYTIIPFMPPDVATVRSGVSDLNENGYAVGTVEIANGTVAAFHFDIVNEQYTALEGGSSTGAGGLNNLSQIVGNVGDNAAFWPNATAVPVLLPSLGPMDPQSETVSWTTAINDDGVVIGASEEDLLDDEGHVVESMLTAVAWRVVVDNEGTHIDGPLPLFPLIGHLESFAGYGCLNELAGGSVQVTGYSSYSVDGSLPSAAVVWSINLTSEGTLGQPSSPMCVVVTGSSRGGGINNFGDVCGEWDNLPFVASVGEAAQTLPVSRNTADGFALDINDTRETVGYLDIYPKGSKTSAQDYHAFLWKGSDRIDLHGQIDPNSGWDQLRWATAINNAGIIAGWGEYDVNHRGYLLIPNTSK